MRSSAKPKAYLQFPADALEGSSTHTEATGGLFQRPVEKRRKHLLGQHERLALAPLELACFPARKNPAREIKSGAHIGPRQPPCAPISVRLASRHKKSKCPPDFKHSVGSWVKFCPRLSCYCRRARFSLIVSPHLAHRSSCMLFLHAGSTAMSFVLCYVLRRSEFVFQI